MKKEKYKKSLTAKIKIFVYGKRYILLDNIVWEN